MTIQNYSVTGMTCEHCARAVTEELSSLATVDRVDVSLVANGVSTVTITSTGPLPGPAIEAALDEAGGYRLLD
jgi:copper chaperone